MANGYSAVADDEAEMRRLLENWVTWRDAGVWDRFATLWHPQGYMNAAWFQADAADFIARSRQASNNSLKVLHRSRGGSIDVAADRAVAQTKMQLMQRHRSD